MDRGHTFIGRRADFGDIQKVPKFPTRNIKTPIVLVYGGSDSLVDIDVMLKELPHHTIAKEVPHYEHLDFLWGQEVESLVFPHVFEALTAYSGRDHTNIVEFRHRIFRNGRLAVTETSEDELSSPMSDISKTSGNRTSPSMPRNRRHMSPPSSSSTDQASTVMDGAGDARTASRAKQPSSMLGKGLKHACNRSGSTSSNRSFDSTHMFGERGISLGAAKAVTGSSNPSKP